MADASVARRGMLAAGGWARAKLVELFGADLRSLAMFRMALALLVLADLASRATDLTAHYTDWGILPRWPLVEEVLNRWQFSLNLMNGEPFFQALLFGLAALAAVGLLVGYRTRLMTVTVWVLVLSIQFRNPVVSTGGDVLLHILLFWAMFLPLGAYWSVDRALKSSPPRLSMRFLSFATAALFIQIACMYWFSAIMKTGREWRVDGTAIYYTLSIDRYTSPLGEYLLHFPELLKVLTFATIGLEAFGPFLLFCPFLTGLVRTGTVLAFMSLHLGIWLAMDIGLFPWISALCMVCFLPTWFWNKAAKVPDAFPARFEGVRRLQHATARFVRDYAVLLHARLSALAGLEQPSFAGTAPQDASDGLNNLAALMTMHPSATMKIWRGETRPVTRAPGGPESQRGDGATVPEPTTLRSWLGTNLLALFLLLYVIWWNLGTISVLTMPEPFLPIGNYLGLAQNWNMFAPAPDKDDYWFVLPGTLRNGQQVDLMPVTRGDLRPHALSWERPDNVASTYENAHWLKYLDSIWYETYSTNEETKRLYFAYYICREWNARHSGAEQLATFQIASMWHETLPNNRHTPAQRMVLWKHSCV